jgi:regulator of replication initiation timing/heme exporter protein D
MNGWEALALAVASMIMLITGVGGYLLRRLKALEGAQEQRHRDDLIAAREKRETAEKERDEFRQEIDVLKPLADKVPGLEKQVATLCAQIEDLQKRVEDSERREAEKDTENDKLNRENRALERQNADLFEANKRLSYENGAYKNALALLGIERAERESLEQKPAVEAPEPSEELAEKKDG